MKYQILGTLRLATADHFFQLSAHKVEMLLALFLARGGQVISTDKIIDEIWVGGRPRRADAAVHVYVSQLRKFLSQVDDTGGYANTIHTKPHGYLLRIRGDQLDSNDFVAEVSRGRHHYRALQFEDARREFSSGLNRWRGPVLDGLSAPTIDRFAVQLNELRLQAQEMMFESQLRMGNHREAISELYSSITDNPLCESFYRLLMLALYESDRRADALKVYHTARERIVGELGLEPCRAMQELHHAILVDDRTAVWSMFLDDAMGDLHT
jgi:SARP family transcriptional regulator, regulator of embCAB operon